MNLLAQTALLVSLTSLGMAMSVLARRLQNRLLFSFSAMCGAVFVWSLSFFLEQVFAGGGYYAVHLLAGVWLGPVALHFLRIWVGRFPEGWIALVSRALWAVSLLSAVVLTVVWGLSWGRGGVAHDSILPVMLFSPITVVLQVFVILATRRPLSLRDGVIFGGALMVLALSTMDHVPWMGHLLPSLGNLLLCVYLILLGQAIRQQKLLDLPLLFTRFVVLLVLAVVLTGVYLLLVAWIKQNPVLFLLNSFAVSFLIVMLLNPLQRTVSALTDRLLAHRDADWRRRLEQSMQSLRSAADLQSWQEGLREGVSQALLPASLRLVLLHQDPAEAMGALSEEMRDRRDSGRLSVLVEPLLQAEIERTSSARVRLRLQAVLDDLRRTGANCVLPLFERQLLGWVLVDLSEVPRPRAAGLQSWRQLREVEELLDEAGRSLALLLRVRDEAERERLATLGEMAAGLAHEIRNPLGAIQGAAELLPDEPAMAPWTRVIREEVARLNHVVSRFLVYSRRSSPELEAVRLDEWLHRAATRLESSVALSQPERSLAVRCNDSPAIKVEMDPEAIIQVLENLVRNSADAGAREVSFSATLSRDGRWALIDVRDNGRGVSEEIRKKLFVPFFTTSHSGTGLGLSICQRILESHHGRIELLEGLATGACFRLRFPTRRGV